MKITLLVGRTDRPTDGVRDYCRHLTQALRGRGHETAITELEWMNHGWIHQLRGLHHALEHSQPGWAILQYTALGWSKRGFPPQAAAVAAFVKRRGWRLAVVFHDSSGFGGSRLRDISRRAVQQRVMRFLALSSERVIATVNLRSVPWLKAWQKQTYFIPVGANILPHKPTQRASRGGGDSFTVCIFGVTERNRQEVEQVAAALNEASRRIGAIRAVVIGRGALEARRRLENLLGPRVALTVVGVADEDTISYVLSCSEALLFVRGAVSSRRSTIVSAMAHGLPVVGFRGRETEWPITDGGLLLAEPGDGHGLVDALVRLAEEPEFARNLRLRSHKAYEDHFDWPVIAQRFEAILG